MAQTRREFIGVMAGVAGSLALTRHVYAQSIQLRVLHYMDDTGNRAILQKIFRQFEAENPGITIEDFATKTEQVVPEAQAAVAARRPYDVAQVLTRVAIGARAVTNARPFSEAPDGGAFMENFALNLRDIGRFDDEYYLSPHALGTPLLYANKDIMAKAGLDPEKLPATLQEMQAMGRQIKEKTGINSVFITTGGLDLGPQTLIRLAGSPYLDGNHAAFNTPEGIAAMQYWQDIAKEGLMPRVSDREAGNIFSAGELAFYLSTSARLINFTETTVGHFRLGVAETPAWKDKPVLAPNSGSGMMVTAQQPDRIEAAFRLVAFLARPDISNFWSRSTGYMPVSVDPMSDPEMIRFVKENPFYGVLVRQMKNTVATALWPGDRVVEAQTVMANLVSDLWEEKGSAAELVPIAAEKVSQILAESTDN